MCCSCIKTSYLKAYPKPFTNTIEPFASTFTCKLLLDIRLLLCMTSNCWEVMAVKLNCVLEFTYLASNISSDGCIDD